MGRDGKKRYFCPRFLFFLHSILPDPNSRTGQWKRRSNYDFGSLFTARKSVRIFWHGGLLSIAYRLSIAARSNAASVRRKGYLFRPHFYTTYKLPSSSPT